MQFKANDSREELDVLLANMNELQVTNLVKVLDIYITLRSLWEIETRMLDMSNAEPTHESQMKWVLAFRDMIQWLIKSK